MVQRNKKLEEYLNKAKDLKQKYKTLFDKYNESEKANKALINERDEYKNKYDKLLEDIVKKNKETKIFKNNLLALINTTQFTFKKQIKKDIKRVYQEEKIYDYLCLRLEKKIIDGLKDSHFDGKTVFTESIKYIIDDEKHVSSDCILYITMEYFYLYNYNYKQCFSSPLAELNLLSISKTSNYVSLFFKRSEGVIFETFRILELINFMKLVKKQKSLVFQISIEPYIYIQPNETTNNNFIENGYYGKAAFSGSFTKQVDRIFMLKNEERFAVLCEIGLIILESPNGKPKKIINLLFADISRFNTREGNNGLAINVAGNVHKFIFENDKIRNEWESKINAWKKSNDFLTKF